MQIFPKVSILIPARNEAKNILKCLNSLTHLDYPKFDITVIDDASDDNTGDISRSMAAASIPRINIIRNDSLPSGWTGKNHALHIGQQSVDGEWLLFTDADTFHHPKSLSTVIHFAETQTLDFLSYSPEQECVTFWEKVIQPIVFSFLTRAFPLNEINKGNQPAAANGQYILVRRSAYEAFGGHEHEAVRSEVLEDVAIARLARANGFKTGFYPGAGLVRTRMYRTFGEIWNGWTKGLFALLNYSYWRVFLIMVETLISNLLPLFGLGVSALLWYRSDYIKAIVVAILTLIILAGMLTKYYHGLKENRFPTSCLVFYPLSAILFVLLLVASVYRHATKTVEWKGRTYSR